MASAPLRSALVRDRPFRHRLIAATTVALAASTLSDFEAFGQSGGTIATIVSASFLFAIAIMNLIILRDVWTRFRRVARGEPMAEADADMLFSGRGRCRGFSGRCSG